MMRLLAGSPNVVVAFRATAPEPFKRHFRAEVVYAAMADYLDEIADTQPER